MAISGVFSPVNLITFILRLVLFFVFIGLLILVFIGFQEIVNTSEDDRATNSLAESLMTSSLTQGKAVFLLDSKIGGFSLDDLNGNNAELPRYCNSGALFRLKRLRDGKEWKWGYAKADVPEKTRKYIAWVKDGSATEQAVLSVAITKDQATQLGCAIERAFAFKEVQEFELLCSADECNYFRQDQNFCIGEGSKQSCRWLPDIPFESFNSASAKIYVVPIKKGGSSSCAKGEIPSGAFKTDADRAGSDVEKIAFCLR